MSPPRARLGKWAARLQCFRYYPAAGGHANDADTLRVYFQYEHERDVRTFFATLAVDLVWHEEQPEADDDRPSIVPGTRFLEQPGWVTIAGVELYAYCHDSLICLSLLGEDLYNMRDADAKRALAVEGALAEVALPVVWPYG
jgi:hypothetical protein